MKSWIILTSIGEGMKDDPHPLAVPVSRIIFIERVDENIVRVLIDNSDGWSQEFCLGVVEEILAEITGGEK